MRRRFQKYGVAIQSLLYEACADRGIRVDGLGFEVLQAVLKVFAKASIFYQDVTGLQLENL